MGGGQSYVCAPPPHFQTLNLGLGIEPTDICDITLAWLASRVCYGSSMVGPVRCPPPHFVTFLRRCDVNVMFDVMSDMIRGGVGLKV